MYSTVTENRIDYKTLLQSIALAYTGNIKSLSLGSEFLRRSSKMLACLSKSGLILHAQLCCPYSANATIFVINQKSGFHSNTED